jgi:hypothetical protein
MMLVGLVMMISIIKGPVQLFNIYFDTNTLLYAAALIISGFQAINFAIFTRTYAIQVGFLPDNKTLHKMYKYVNLESGLVVGLLVTFVGFAGSAYSLYLWDQVDFGHLDYSSILRVVIPSVVSIIIGLQILLSSFFLSVLGVNKK